MCFLGYFDTNILWRNRAADFSHLKKCYFNAKGTMLKPMQLKQ